MEELDSIADLISHLSDLELAMLVSLIAQEHCLIETNKDCVEEISKELALVLSSISLESILDD
jgi:hypothetical protein